MCLKCVDVTKIFILSLQLLYCILVLKAGVVSLACCSWWGSVLVEKFGIVLISVILILIGFDIVAVYYGVAGLSSIIAVDLVVIGFVVLVRGFVEKDVGEKRYFYIWGSILIDTSISIALATLLGWVLGLAVFLIGLGLVFLFISLL